MIYSSIWLNFPHPGRDAGCMTMHEEFLKDVEELVQGARLLHCFQGTEVLKMLAEVYDENKL